VIERAGPLADLVDALETSADLLVERTRRLTEAGWRAPAGSHGSGGDALHALVVTLAGLEHAVAIGPATPPAVWRAPARPAYDGALPGRLAVVAGDLIAALRAAPEDYRAWYDGRVVPVSDIAAAALTVVRATSSHLSR
jgi:hypothetical protein